MSGARCERCQTGDHDEVEAPDERGVCGSPGCRCDDPAHEPPAALLPAVLDCDDAPCAVCGTARGEHRLTVHEWTALPSPADEALRALRSATTRRGPERRMRSLVDAAHERIREAVAAARLAGRLEVVVDEHPGPAAREQYDRADRAAVLALELAEGAVDALVRGPR